MAELNVVRKKKSPLPWIILALIILALLAYLLLSNNNDGAESAAGTPAYDSATTTEGADR